MKDFENFIGSWVIDEKVIDDLNEYADDNANNFKPGGTVINQKLEVDKDRKDSLDFIVSPEEPDVRVQKYRDNLQECLLDYIKKYEYANDLLPYNICEYINLQKYKPGGGFKVWHFENNHNKKTTFRNLVFMTYLNDVEDGGTEFYYQNLTVPCKKGLTIIWPAYFTHTHRGQISQTKEKRIITGWYSTLPQYR